MALEEALRTSTRKWPIWITLGFALALQARAVEVPKAEISNGQIRATIYLPDARTGWYRSTRFDWSGIISSLKYGGHEYYGPWFSKVDPSVRDFDYAGSSVVVSALSSAMGPAEEYQTDGKALGYDEAKGGGTFIKIGVGVLRKPPDEVKYDHYKEYEIVDSGKWSVHKSASSVEFTQEVSDPGSQYGYRYTKIVRLVKDKPELVIEHVLKNTGARAIRSTMYNHNFLVLDGQAPGPTLVTRTAYPIKSQHPPEKGIGEIRGDQLVYLKTLENKERMTASLTGFGSSRQ